jgi:rhamnosyltransferase
MGRMVRFDDSPKCVDRKVAAIIVAYLPAPAQIGRLIAALVIECEIVYVMDNGGGREAITDSLRTHPSVRIVDMNGNRGIGEALNLGFQMAKMAGVTYVATFDQDSQPPEGLAGALVKATEQIASDGVRVAAVGPQTVDIRSGTRVEHRFMRRQMGWPAAVKYTSASNYIDVDFLITSGCLISLAAYEVVGPFDGELFVDCTDMEWCFRARARGFQLYGVHSTSMPHELGNGANARVMGITLLGHSPVRRYYYARNTVRLLKLSHVAAGWKVRMLAGLAARIVLLPIVTKFAPGWSKDWLMLARGTFDGIAGAGGAFKH